MKWNFQVEYLLCSRVSGWNNYYVVDFPGGIIIM